MKKSGAISSLKPAILALDQGSSHSRGVLFDTRGTALAQFQVPLRAYYPQPGWVEHQPEEILQETLIVIRQLMTFCHQGGWQPLALGLANQRSTFICWDKTTGKPLSPAISWQDLRTANAIHKREVPELSQKTGLRLTPYYSASKLAWVLKHLKNQGVSIRNLLCGTINSYLIWHFTCGRHLTDPTNAARMLLYNLNSGQWDKDLLRHFKIPISILPEVYPTQAYFGEADIDGHFIPITCSIGDQQASLAGMGLFESGEANINYGTGGFFLVNTGPRRIQIPGLLTSVAWSNAKETTYLLEGTVNAVGSLFHWLCELGLLGSEREIDLACSRARERILFLPAPIGLGAPHWEDKMRTALLGLSHLTRREDIVRGAVEGIASLMNDIYVALCKKIKIKNIVASGGGSQIPFLIQHQADLLGRSLGVSNDPESTVRGAAFLAGAQAEMTDTTQFQFSAVQKEVHPTLSTLERNRLNTQWKKTLSITRQWTRLGEISPPTGARTIKKRSSSRGRTN